jgi:clusterin-associated protein 1
MAAISAMPPLDDVGRGIRVALSGASTRVDELTKQIELLNGQEDALRSKIATRKRELERQGKRLVAIKSLRPGYMDEYEALEADLARLFGDHFKHYRTVDYLEHEIQMQAERWRKARAVSIKRIEKVKRKGAQKIVKSMMNSITVAASELGDEMMLIGRQSMDLEIDDGF